MLVSAIFLVVPLTSLLSGALVGLVTLRYGFQDGALVLASAMAIAAVLAQFTIQPPGAVLDFGLMMGLPVLLLATVLRFSASQGVALAAAGLIAAVVICGVHLLSADPVQWWRGVLDHVVAQRIQSQDPAVAQGSQALEQLNHLLDAVAPWMTLFPIWAIVLSLLVVLLARWWHSILDNPGGFGREFRGLRLDRRVGLATIAVAVFSLVAGRAAAAWRTCFFSSRSCST